MYLARNKRLLEAFKRGDTAAMEDIYRHYLAGVTTFLRKGFSFRSGRGQYYFKGIQEVSDLRAAVQEVFRRAFEDRARTSYNGINSFSNWVLAIGRNMVINQFRNREVALSDYISSSDERSHLAFMDDEVTEEFSGVLYGENAARQDFQFESVELQQLIARFMHSLTEHDRRLLVFRFAEGKGQEDTAILLKSTRMRVRTSEARLRTRLRAYLRNSGYIDHIPVPKPGADGADGEPLDSDEDSNAEGDSDGNDAGAPPAAATKDAADNLPRDRAGATTTVGDIDKAG